jgi:hypothetical protein
MVQALVIAFAGGADKGKVRPYDFRGVSKTMAYNENNGLSGRRRLP